MASRDPVFHLNQILFEDEDLIAISKPPGLPTQSTRDPHRPHLFGLLSEFLKRRDGDRAYTGLHHRLDLDTTGVVLFTKTQRANAPIAQLFREHKIQKTYLALVQPKDTPKASHISFRPEPGAELTIRDHLKAFDFVHPTNKRKIQKMKVVTSGGDAAETHFVWREIWPNGCALVEAQPHTGRTHQIRVHLAEEVGFGILGDRLYGSPRDLIKVRRILLHAKQLDFNHPLTQKLITITCPLPGDFESALSKLNQIKSQ